MDINKTKLAQIARQYGLSQILLFGSQASWQTTAESDFDLGILAPKPLSPRRKETLLIDLSQKLNLPIQKIDLTFLNQAGPLLLYQSVKNARLLYGQPKFFTAFQLRAVKQYQDHQKFFKLRDNYLRQQYKK
ncbi:MAG: nucleotidyltransferase domain-containing protein [Patescibacteria group bacterium]